MMPETTSALGSERTDQRGTIPLLEHRVTRLEQRLDEHGGLHQIRRDLGIVRDRQGWMLWGVAAVIMVTLGTGGTVATRMILSALDTTARTAQEERLEAIADAIEQGDIPATSAGPPRLYALQQRLPQIRGITRAERAAACLRAETRVPGVCSPPGPDP